MKANVNGETQAMNKPKGILEQMREYTRIKGTAGIAMAGQPHGLSLNNMSEGEYITALLKHVRDQRTANTTTKEYA